MSIAYRAWVATDAGRLVSLYGWGGWQARGWNTAAPCSKHATPAPAVDCTCGINVVEDLEEMVTFAQRNNDLRWDVLPVVIGAVEHDGAQYPGAFIDTAREGLGDPPSTLRVRRARLVRIVAVAPAAGPLFPALRRTLGADVLEGEVRIVPRATGSGDQFTGLAAEVVELQRQVFARLVDPRLARVDPAGSVRGIEWGQALTERIAGARLEDLPAIRDELTVVLQRMDTAGEEPPRAPRRGGPAGGLPGGTVRDAVVARRRAANKAARRARRRPR